MRLQDKFSFRMYNVCDTPAHAQRHGHLPGHAQLLIIFSFLYQEDAFEIYKYLHRSKNFPLYSHNIMSQSCIHAIMFALLIFIIILLLLLQSIVNFGFRSTSIPLAVLYVLKFYGTQRHGIGS